MTRTQAIRNLRAMIRETPSSNTERIARLNIRIAEWQNR